MKIVLIGSEGTLGKRLFQMLLPDHEVITAGRTSGDVRVDITSHESIEDMYKTVSSVDAVICTAASGKMDTFSELTIYELLLNMHGKFFGQVDLVLTGQKYLNDQGCFILTSGIFADQPSKGVTGGGVISGGLHSFVLSAALELDRGLRINVVSPGMVEDSAQEYGHLFPDLKPVPMERITAAYQEALSGQATGRIMRIY